MSVDFATAQSDFESWRHNYLRKVPGSKDRLSRMTLIRHFDLENCIQQELLAANSDSLQRYVFVGKCTADRGFTGVLNDAIPKSSLYQQVKECVKLHRLFVVDLHTVQAAELGCTHEALLLRCAGSWSLNSPPSNYRFVFSAIFSTSQSDVIVSQSRPATASVLHKSSDVKAAPVRNAPNAQNAPFGQIKLGQSKQPANSVSANSTFVAAAVNTSVNATVTKTQNRRF